MRIFYLVSTLFMLNLISCLSIGPPVAHRSEYYDIEEGMYLQNQYYRNDYYFPFVVNDVWRDRNRHYLYDTHRINHHEEYEENHYDSYIGHNNIYRRRHYEYREHNSNAHSSGQGHHRNKH